MKKEIKKDWNSEQICGEDFITNYDKVNNKITIELEKNTDKFGTSFFEVAIYDSQMKKELLRLHIKEAIELKSIIDKFIVDMIQDRGEEND